MSFKSLKQNSWAHTATGTKALGGPAKVKEWEHATNYSKLPKKVHGGNTVLKPSSLKAQALCGAPESNLKCKQEFANGEPYARNSR
jgi:hypothetical protein